jgi:hypothetical protein
MQLKSFIGFGSGQTLGSLKPIFMYMLIIPQTVIRSVRKKKKAMQKRVMFGAQKVASIKKSAASASAFLSGF